MSFDVNKFLNAQDSGVYELALKEIKSGRKMSHWMWYVFPQISGLGWSWMAQKYEIPSIKDAKEYFANDVLRERLIEISNAVYEIEDKDVDYIFGYPDDLKFKSCMTLFALIAPQNERIFKRNLDKYYNGEMCEHTLNKFIEENNSTT